MVAFIFICKFFTLPLTFSPNELFAYASERDSCYEVRRRSDTGHSEDIGMNGSSCVR